MIKATELLDIKVKPAIKKQIICELKVRNQTPFYGMNMLSSIGIGKYSRSEIRKDEINLTLPPGSENVPASFNTPSGTKYVIREKQTAVLLLTQKRERNGKLMESTPMIISEK